MPNLNVIIKAMQTGKTVLYINEFSKVVSIDSVLYIRHKYGFKIPLIDQAGELHGKPSDYIIICKTSKTK